MWKGESDTARCSHCGTYDWEWQNDDGTMKAAPYEADGWRCFGCKEVERKLREIEHSTKATDGLRVRLFRTEG